MSTATMETHVESETRDPLADLATQINQEHEAASKAMRTSLEHARRAGKLLIQAKAQLDHGEWGDWLQTPFQRFTSERDQLHVDRETLVRDRIETGRVRQFEHRRRLEDVARHRSGQGSRVGQTGR